MNTNHNANKRRTYDDDTLLYIYEQILEKMPEWGILVVDRDQNVLLYNDVSSSFDGLPCEEVIGHPMQRIVKGSWDNVLGAVMETGVPKLNYTNHYVIEDGKTISVFGNAIPIKRNGVVIAAYSMLRLQETLHEQIKLYSRIQRIIDNKKSPSENGTKYCLEDIKGESGALRSAIDQCRTAARTTAPVLIYGETGTGKELFAQGIHNACSNRNARFVAINCAAIPDTLLESIMFGTVKGAFTGAENSAGLFEEAEDGTIFLDEINSMPFALQSKLLRVLQERLVRRVGGKEDIRVKCRIISACNKQPEQCLQDGDIRPDLYYRISAIEIDVPPLRERGEDIILLADFYNKNYSREYGIQYRPFSEGAKNAMRSYTWPGNIRELQNMVESTILLAEDTEIISADSLRKGLQEYVSRTATTSSVPAAAEITREPLEARLLSYERQQILLALEENNWNITRAADALGYKRPKLQYRMKKLNIEQP